MAKIDELIPKLQDEADKEYEMFSGGTRREFFIEVFGAEDVDDLLDKFKPTEHNEKWDSERQQESPDIDVLMLNRRAIAFMASGRIGCFKRYKETELRQHVMGKARMAKQLYMLDNTKSFTSMEMAK